MLELYNGDCLEVMKQIPSASVDMVLCDLPYGTTACAWDSVLPLDLLWVQYSRISKFNTPFVMFASQPFTSILGTSNVKSLKYSWYWRKSRATGHLNAKKMPMKDIEDILVFYDSLPKYNSQGLVAMKTVRRNSASDMARGVTSDPTSVITGGIKNVEYTQEYTNYPRQVLDFASEGSTVHPTQKPVALLEYLVKTYTNPGDVVLDNTMGSGSTGVACANTGRKFIGIEKDEKYFQIAKKRVEEAYANSLF